MKDLILHGNNTTRMGLNELNKWLIKSGLLCGRVFTNDGYALISSFDKGHIRNNSIQGVHSYLICVNGTFTEFKKSLFNYLNDLNN